MRNQLIYLFANVLVVFFILPARGQGDSFLHLSASGFAFLSDASVDDLDYTKDFTIEVIFNIDPNQPGGHAPYILAKAEKWGYFLDNRPGYLIGLRYGHNQSYGQVIVGKVGDGTKHIVVGSREWEGCVYAVMTWNVSEKILVLYINGEKEAQGSNSEIAPHNIKNDAPLGLGLSQGYGTLGRDIYVARLWNRRLSREEIQLLWDHFNSSGRHTLPAAFDRDSLHSEWLMYETSVAQGGDGTTHIKDTAGLNNLELSGGAVIERGYGSLSVVSPIDLESGVDKSVYLTIRGGEGALQGEFTLPLHYFFQVDESPAFDTPALRNSGWIVHHSRWNPILKPNTEYYWRVKVRDSSDSSKESAFTAVCTFTTEGPSIWYVRPRNNGVTYGTEDGTSFENAFNGFVNWNDNIGARPGIIWGPEGVEAGDSLYVCDVHELQGYAVFPDYRYIYVGTSGYSEDYPITIRGDHPLHPGLIKGVNGGYEIKIDRKKYIVFRNLTIEAFNLSAESLDDDGHDVTVTNDSRSTHITFDGCNLSYGKRAFVWLYTGHDYWTFRNNTMTYAGNGIYTVTKGTEGANYLTVENNTIKHIGTGQFEDSDAHAVGVQGGEGHLIQGNYIEDTGDAIGFWASTKPMRNMTVRYNFIKNVTKKKVTMGDGIVISGENNNSYGMRTGFKVYGNIIVNAERAGISSNNKDFIEVYNNVIYHCGIGLRFGVMDAPLAAAVYNNIILEPDTDFIYVYADAGKPWLNVSWDNNLYYPVLSQIQNFYTARTYKTTFADYRSVLGWDMNSLLENPRFVSKYPLDPQDFRLDNGSPAIDAGRDVGISQDFAGMDVPCGAMPDIGAYEYPGEE